MPGEHDEDELKVSVSITEKVKSIISEYLSAYDCPTGAKHTSDIENIKGEVDSMKITQDKIFSKIDGIYATLLAVAGAVIIELVGIVVIVITRKG